MCRLTIMCVYNQNQQNHLAQCLEEFPRDYGVNVNVPPLAHMFNHLVPIWWHYLGTVGDFWEVEPAGGGW